MITVEGAIPAEVDVTGLQSLLETASVLVGRRGIVRLGLRFANVAQMQQLVSSYTESSAATDVLSFESDSSDPDDIGDIVICDPVARQQAAEAGTSFSAEVDLLFLHGILHLFGLDHNTQESRRHMEELQQQILKKNQRAGRSYL